MMPIPRARRSGGTTLGNQLLDDPRPDLEPVRVVMTDQAIRGIEDGAAGPVVAAQHDHLRVPVALPELEDVADGRPAELVDRLVVVADDGHVAMALGDQRDELRLGTVRVLELVHQDVPEPVLDLLPRGRRVAQQPQGERDLVPKVDRPVGGEQVLVHPVGAGELAPPRMCLRCAALAPGWQRRTGLTVFRRKQPAPH